MNPKTGALSVRRVELSAQTLVRRVVLRMLVELLHGFGLDQLLALRDELRGRVARLPLLLGIVLVEFGDLDIHGLGLDGLLHQSRTRCRGRGCCRGGVLGLRLHFFRDDRPFDVPPAVVELDWILGFAFLSPSARSCSEVAMCSWVKIRLARSPARLRKKGLRSSCGNLDVDPHRSARWRRDQGLRSSVVQSNGHGSGPASLRPAFCT